MALLIYNDTLKVRQIKNEVRFMTFNEAKNLHNAITELADYLESVENWTLYDKVIECYEVVADYLFSCRMKHYNETGNVLS